MTTVDEPPRGVDLAKEPDFRLGGLTVSPSTSRVRVGASEQRVEPRVMQVLVVLVRNAPRTVSRDELIDACWGGRVVSDDAVARVVAQVRALARVAEPAPFTLETVPKVGFRLIPAESAETEAPTAPDSALATRRSGRPTLVIAATLALAVAAIAGWGFWRLYGPETNPAYGQAIRADVMQFEARRPDPELRRVSAALAESVVRRLTRAGIHAAQRPLPRDGGGDSGDAEFRVVGSVDRQGDDILVEGQLIDRKSGLVLWSAHGDGRESLDEDMIQQFAGGMAGAMQCALDDRRISRAPMSSNVLSLYLNTCDAVIRGDGGDGMVAAARRLVAAAPNLAGAHAMLGIALSARGQDGVRPGVNAAADLSAAAQEATRALQLDPHTPKAYIAREQSRGPGNWIAREEDLKAALAIDPDLPPPQFRLAGLLREVGRIKEAITVATATAALDDARAGDDAKVRLAFIQASAGDLDAADNTIQGLGEGSDQARFMRWTIAFFWRDPKEALALMSKPGEGPRSPTMRACVGKYLGGLASGGARRGLPAECAHVDPSWPMRMLAREGDLDAAYAAVKLPLSRDETTQLFYSDMKVFRADPRFMPLVKRIGLVDYWRQSGHWPDFCLAPDRPYDCQAVAKGL